MHKRRPEFFLVDILLAIHKIRRKTDSMTFQEFASEEDCIDAVLKNLEVIGEAIGQLLKYSDFLTGVDGDWRRIVNLRNVLVHFYFGINLQEIYGIAQNKVPLLEEDILHLIKTKGNLQQTLLVIQDAKADLAVYFHNESIAYLEEVEKKLQ